MAIPHRSLGSTHPIKHISHIYIYIYMDRYSIYVKYPSTQRWHRLPNLPSPWKIVSIGDRENFNEMSPTTTPGDFVAIRSNTSLGFTKNVFIEYFLSLIYYHLKVYKERSDTPKSKTIYYLWVKCLLITTWPTWMWCFAPAVFNNSDFTIYEPL